MPRLWSQTIEAHRHVVREAILDATAGLVAEKGLTGVTMSQVAGRSGIGRATLYKYFPDVDSILVAWHERHLAGHLKQLLEIRDSAATPGERLDAVLQRYAAIQQGRARHGDTEPAANLHRSDHVTGARRRLHELIRDLLAEAEESGDIRSDVSPDELAEFCLHAINAAADLPSPDAADRLIAVIRAGLSSPSPSGVAMTRA